ncbi:MAG: tripartite tricarboxylate transporter substrate binding protein [Burkholderiales bacterium]
MRRASVCRSALLALSAAVSLGNATAQSYPNKPIRVLVGFPPGGVADVLARIIGPKLADHLGQPLIVENRAGAGSNIAAETVARAPADGYTLFVYSTVNAVNVSLFTKLAYDPIKDFAPVSLIASMANILVVNPSVPANSVQELIALARARPGQLNFGSAGNGTTQHLSGQLFKSMAGIDISHIAYKGSVPAMTAVLAGEIPMMFNVMSTVLPQLKAGKVRALAVSSGKRSVLTPELPTVAEAGLPGFDYVSYFGVLAPAGTPREIVSRLNAEIVKILDATDMKARLADVGAEPVTSTPERFGAFIQEEIKKSAAVVKESGARAD